MMSSAATAAARIPSILRSSLPLPSDLSGQAMMSSVAITAARIPAILRSSLPPSPDLSGKGSTGGWRRNADVSLPSSACRENAILKPCNEEYRSKGTDNRLEATELPKRIAKSHEEESEPKVHEGRELWQMINEVKSMLSSMGDGEITSSAYDTAWVAMVPALDGSCGPQFPSSLRWIIDNQLDDGSWGDRGIFSAHDRIISTLACAVALRSWGVCHEQCERGLLFLKENMWRLGEEEDELMPIGFEVAFPSLMDIAKGLGLDFPYDDPALLDVYAKREIKLKRIPRKVMHKVPTTLLHSLEGMPGLEWDKLLRLQSLEGSFLFSPSSTAYALMQTGDLNCLRYLRKAVDRFHGGVPNVYPVDIFEHLWVVDRLERLGISRYFKAQIKECMEYVYSYWTEHGLCWARNSEVRDIDDTAMGFRLLRLYGYTVSPDALRNFERDGEFFGFAGQSNQAVTGMYNLNRASQIMFPGEEILEQAKSFSCRFLKEKQASNQLLDKWVIAKDIPGEVAYALDFPFYASLPRIEARCYVEQYGAVDDVWIGKTLYRMLYVNNAVFLDLAKADFNQCQAIHQVEWLCFQRWCEECRMRERGVRRKSALRAYFLAAASIFEPDRSAERLGWARTAVLAEAVATFFLRCSGNDGSRHRFIRDFLQSGRQRQRSGCSWAGEGLVGTILDLIDQLTAATDKRNRLQANLFSQHLRRAWEDWLLKVKEGEARVRRWSMEGETALLLARTVELCAGRTEPEGEVAQLEYASLSWLTVSICGQLQASMCVSTKGNKESRARRGKEMESEMQELVKCVLETGSSNGLSDETKRTFLAITKSFYYMAYCPSCTLNKHIAKVLFEPVK